MRAQPQRDGCDFHSDCLTCPLLVCRYDLPRGLKAVLTLARDETIRGLKEAGFSVSAIARRVKLSERRCSYILAKQAACLPTGDCRTPVPITLGLSAPPAAVTSRQTSI